MLSTALIFVIAAAPTLPGEIPAPFGHYGSVVGKVPAGGLPGNDKVLLPAWEGCDPQAIFVMRFFSGTARALEQLQQSLDRAPGVEKKLFGRVGTLGELMRSLGSSTFDARRDCTEPKLAEGFKLELTALPKKWCDAPATAQDGAFWYAANGKSVAVLNVAPGGEKACRPRLSAVLFDAKGVARLRVQADWAGEVSATLLGDRCQVLEYTLDREKQAMTPAWKSCKR